MSPESRQDKEPSSQADHARHSSGSVENKESGDGLSVLLIPAPDQTEMPTRISLNGITPTTTIREIRERARSMIASQPDIGRLRLIYSGRLLSQDDHTVERLVGLDSLAVNRTIAIHLILRPLPGTARAHPGTRTDSPVNTVAHGGHPETDPSLLAGSVSITPQMQAGPRQAFPTRPASTPATGSGSGPFLAPAQVHSQAQGPAGFASHGSSVAQQAQFMHQLQQQHLNMMHAMLRQSATQSGNALPSWQTGNQMTMSDFQRVYNQQSQSRQMQQQPLNGRTTPQGFAHPSAPNIPQGSTTQPHSFQQGTSTGTMESPAPGPTRLIRRNPSPSSTFMSQRVHSAPQALRATPSQSSMYAMADSVTTTTTTRRVDSESVFLLSSPSGFEAILLGPGTGVGSLGSSSLSEQGVYSNGTPRADNGSIRDSAIHDRENEGNGDQNEGPARVIQVQDLIALAMPLGGHLWLLIRLAVAVALLTLHASWSRTLMIWFIASLIFFAQTDAFRPLQRVAEQIWVPVRQHIEDLVRDVDDYEEVSSSGDVVRPEDAARRLLRRRRDQSRIRSIERSLALFVASFVPGVGEAQVAARDAAERRRQQQAEALEREGRERETREREAQQQGHVEDPNTSLDLQDERDAPQGTMLSAVDDGNADQLRQRQPRVDDATDGDE